MKPRKSKPTEALQSQQPELEEGELAQDEPARYERSTSERLLAGVEFAAVGLAVVKVPDGSPNQPPKKKYIAVRLAIKDGEVTRCTAFDPESFGAATLDVKSQMGRIFMALSKGEQP